MAEGSLARVPSTLPLEEAGGVPLVALTAWQVQHNFTTVGQSTVAGAICVGATLRAVGNQGGRFMQSGAGHAALEYWSAASTHAGINTPCFHCAASATLSIRLQSPLKFLAKVVTCFQFSADTLSGGEM